MQSKEDILRKRIVAALKNNKNVSNVQEIHGTHEYGVDIIFDLRDGFTKPLHCGVQVKSGDITASIVQITLGQLSIAFGHRFSTDGDHLDIVYVATDGEIIAPATEHAVSANVGFRNVIWLDGNKLDIFFETYEKISLTQEGVEPHE